MVPRLTMSLFNPVTPEEKKQALLLIRPVEADSKKLDNCGTLPFRIREMTGHHFLCCCDTLITILYRIINWTALKKTRCPRQPICLLTASNVLK